MNFTALDTTGFWLGALAIAGVLFALQRLRVRHREVVVVTTMFWRDALDETRARTLVERFRHPLVYLFLLLLALTAWLGVAAPRIDRDDGFAHVFLLDLSASMAVGQRFDDNKRALAAEVARTERAHRRVVACGAGLETLLAPGEDELLLSERLALVEPQACAPSVERALLAFAAGASDERPLRVHVFGAAPVRAEVLARLGDRVTVQRVGPREPAPLEVRVPAIVSMAAAPSAAARDQVDVWVEVDGASGPPRIAGALRRGTADLGAADVGARATLAPTRVESLRGERSRVVFAGLPADGSVFEVELLDSTAAPLARDAVLVLPDLSPLRVFVGTGLPEPLRLALTSHPGVVAVEQGAEVAVRLVDDIGGGDVPALELGASDAAPAFVLVHPPTPDPRSLLFDALGDLGLEWLDAGALANATGRTIELTEVDGPRRSLLVWRELLESDSPFTADAAFPHFVARSLEWLAGRAPSRFAPRVGDSVADARAAFAARGSNVVLEPSGADFVPPRAGLYVRTGEARSGALHALPNLVSAGPPSARTVDAPVNVRAARSAPTAAFDLSNLVLLALLTLLVVEWVLVRRGRLP